jgi:hypothetical protein
MQPLTSKGYGYKRDSRTIHVVKHSHETIIGHGLWELATWCYFILFLLVETPTIFLKLINYSCNYRICIACIIYLFTPKQWHKIRLNVPNL